jgi:DNA-binding response OmpR family regulator
MDDTPATILLAEDDPATRTFLADELTADGYELLLVDTARDALRILETKFPDLAIVDIGLPDGSGLEVVRQVRAADRLASRIDPDIPLLLLTGRAAEVDRVRGFERGADDYVAKPIASVVARTA